MENLLLYNYNIKVTDYNVFKNGVWSFYIDYNKFYFLETSRVKADIEVIGRYLDQNANRYNSIVKCNSGQYFVDKREKTYVLIRVKEPENRELDILDVLKADTPLEKDELSTLNRTEWGILWSEKVDYLEYQVSELATGHEIVTKSFSYYVGLAENAIEYFNMYENKEAIFFICHRRIYYPNLTKNFFNPLEIVVDYRVRDIAEYLKSAFFEGEMDTEEIERIIKSGNLNDCECNLLYARLLYPSYYFDALTEVLEYDKDDDILLKYIAKTGEYELFLKKVYETLSKEYSMIRVDWIANKKAP